jgi:sarcosine oxidase
LARRDWDAIVVGLGGIGSGALYWLARELRGNVLGLEQFGLGHERGASQDWSRIIRYSYHRPHYVRLARRAYEAWRVVEEESGESLVRRVGGLDLFPEGGAIPLEDYTSSLDVEGIPYELLAPPEMAYRWPAFRLDHGVRGLFQQDGGLVRAAEANAAHVGLAREHGGQIREGLEVEGLRSAGGEIDVRVGGARYRCGKLVIAAGAWSNELLGHLGVELPLTVTQEQVVYFEPADPEPLREARFPSWIWMDDPSFYRLT